MNMTRKHTFAALLCVLWAALFLFPGRAAEFAEAEQVQAVADAAAELSAADTPTLSASTVVSGTCGDNVKWTLDENGLLTISGSGPMWNYLTRDIPWYHYKDTIKTIIIRNGVTYIGWNAFSGCSGLTGVTIPNSVTSIGNRAFSGCSGLTSVTIPNSVTSIEESAFFYCSGLTSVTIPNSVTSIRSSAFSNCSGLTGVTIPNSVTSIGAYAFKSCSSLTSVTIPDSVTSIGDWAFSGCSGLTGVTIPDSVTSIGDYAFFYCSGLKDVYYAGTKAQWSAITIGSDNDPLTSANIHYETKNVVDIVDSGACGDNVKWTLDENGLLTISGSGPMWNYDATTMPWYRYRDTIKTIIIENGVTYIGGNAFFYCSGLTGVTIGNSVTSIGESAFFGCSGLTGVTIPNSVTSIGNWAFSDCSGLTSLTIPNSVTSIGHGAFSDCSGLTSLTIPYRVTSIGAYAFQGCSGLTSVTIPDSVTSIGDYAFSDCSGLTSVTIGNRVTSIGNSAFSNCSGLTSVTIPDSVASIGIYAFSGCSGLTKIDVTSTNSAYTSENGILFNKSKTTLVHYPAGKADTVYTIPDSVTSIGDGAFSGCSGLTGVTIPDSVASIGIYAFNSCSGLTGVTIPDSVTSIEEFAFYACTSLTSVTIPDSVTSIGGGAFSDCSGLKDVYYAGTKAQWSAIKIGSDNDPLTSANIHYNGGTPTTYTVTFNANGGKVSPVSMTVAAGGTYGNLPAPTRDGHTFNGWFTSATGGVQVDNDTGADTYGNVTLYAHWTAATYTVTFNANGGKVSPVSMTVAAGGTYGNLPAPTRDGHTFNGWFTSATGGVQVNNDTGADTYGNVTLYAHWTAKTIALEDLSYSFANSYKGLDYPNPYHIPYERYRAIFGDSLFGRMCYKMSGNGRWGGSCYGFSSTAAMFSQQGSGVTVDAFRSGASKPSQLRITDKHAQWNITAREFLEMMQISQNSPVIQADYQNNKNKLAELCAAVADFARTGTNPVIVAVFGKEGGHALLGYGLEKVSDTQSRLMVYDCNFPSQERYVTLTADSAGRYTGWSYRMNDTYNWGSAYKGSWISFVPYADFYKVWTGRGQQTQAAMEMLTVNANVVIKDFEGNAVASLDNGELITMRTDIFPVIQLGLTVDGENPPNDTVSVWIPVDIYDLERTDDYVRVNGEATLMDADSPFQATITHVNQSSDVSTTADGFTFVVDDGTQLNRVMFGENVTAGTYDITFHSTLDGKQEDVQITGTVMSHMMTFAMVNGEAVADAESMVSIQSYMLNGVRVGSGSIAGNAVPLVSFAANKGEGTMSPGKATEDGRFTFPVCEFTPPAGQSFTGWLVNGKVYQPGQSLTLDSDTTAVAQWSGSVPAIQNVTVSGGSIAVAATVPLDGLTVAVCAYAKSGQMLRCASGGSVGLSLDTAGAAYLRAFLLDAGTQRPVCEPYQKNL